MKARPPGGCKTYACMHATYSMSQTLQGEALPLETADLMTHSAEGYKQDSGPGNQEGNVHSQCTALASNQSSALC